MAPDFCKKKFGHNEGFVAIYKNIKELLASRSSFTQHVAALIFTIGRLYNKYEGENKNGYYTAPP